MKTFLPVLTPEERIEKYIQETPSILIDIKAQLTELEWRKDQIQEANALLIKTEKILSKEKYAQTEDFFNLLEDIRQYLYS